MSLSSRFAIALHALSVLAMFSEKEVTSAFIANSINTNPVVARRILASLKAAGLVQTREGAEGGYRLGKPPEAITLDAVYQAVEPGPLFTPHTTEPNQKCPVGHGICSALEGVYAEAEASLNAALAARTLAELVARLPRRGCQVTS